MPRYSPLTSEPSRRIAMIFAVGAVVSCVVLGCCWRSLVRSLIRGGWLNIDMGYTILYVVPDGFRGIFQIVERKHASSAPRDCGNGVFEFVIPPSGILRTRDVTALLTWHEEVARFTDGTRLNVLGHHMVRDDEVALRPIGGIEGGGIEALVGTETEYREYMRDRRPWVRLDAVR